MHLDETSRGKVPMDRRDGHRVRRTFRGKRIDAPQNGNARPALRAVHSAREPLAQRVRKRSMAFIRTVPVRSPQERLKREAQEND